MLWVPSVKEAHLARPSRKTFSMVALSLMWNIFPAGVRLAPILTLFQKGPEDTVLPTSLGTSVWNPLSSWFDCCHRGGGRILVFALEFDFFKPP